MSQAKVDRYKEEKRNREKIIKKQKREWMLTKLGLSAVAVVLIGWAGISVYQGFTAQDTTTAELPSYTVDTAPLDEYLENMSLELE